MPSDHRRWPHSPVGALPCWKVPGVPRPRCLPACSTSADYSVLWAAFISGGAGGRQGQARGPRPGPAGLVGSPSLQLSPPGILRGIMEVQHRC